MTIRHYKKAPISPPAFMLSALPEKMTPSSSAFLLLLLLSWSSAQTNFFTNVTGHADDQGACHCLVKVPDNSFPMLQLEELENTIQTMTIRFEKEVSKIKEYTRSIEVYEKKIQNLTVTVQRMDKSGVTYSVLDFDTLKLEIAEMDLLVTKLKESVVGGNEFVDQLFMEIKNTSVMVHALEHYDKNNVLAIRREMIALKNRLTECEKYTNESHSSFTVQPGSCDHGGILNISKPRVVLLNWRGASYIYGGWGKSYSLQNTTKELYWTAPLNDEAILSYYRTFNSFDDILLYKNYKQYGLTNSGHGSGSAVYDGFLYYNCYNSRGICKVDMNTNTLVLRKDLPDAVVNNRFSYAGVLWQDFDFAVDESGLWVIYATEASAGNIVISKLNETTLTVIKTWQTTVYKPSVTNAFIVCGVFYAVRSVGISKEELFSSYDTKTEQEGRPSIMMEKMAAIIQSINYSPSDQKLYVYSNGYQVTQDITYKPALG